MPEYPAWVQDALANGTVKASELEGWSLFADMLQRRPGFEDLMVSVYESECTTYGNEWFLEFQHPRCEPTAIVSPSPVYAIRAANNLIAALSGSPTAEVERLQKRVGELEESAKALDLIIQNFQEIDDRGIVKVEFTREMADMLWIIHNKALSPAATTGYVGDGAPIQKTDAFGNVEDETL